MSNVLLGNMACFADLGDPNKRYKSFLTVGRPPFKCLIESLLLFDKIVIPTNDFMPLALMAGVLGERPVIQMLDHDIVGFCRFKGSLCYIGNGGGISVFQLASKEKIPRWISAPLDEAAEQALRGLNADFDKHKIVDLAVRSTREISLDVEHLRRMTYGEVAANPGILSGEGAIDLTRLSGIKPDQVRVLSSLREEDQEDDIFQVLRVGQACVETMTAGVSGCEDIYTSDQVSSLFQSALMRAAERMHPGYAYVELKTIANLPDIGELALENKDAIGDILKLRNSASGVQFRSWFQENCRSDPSAVAREYVEVLSSVPGVRSAGVRNLRFLAQIAIGATSALALNPAAGFLAGTAASALDSYLVELMFRGTSPRIFVERLRSLGSKHRN